MTIAELTGQAGLESVLIPDPDATIADGYTSDLLSDVMARAPEGCILITIQAHLNTVAVASLVHARAVLLCNNRPVPSDMLAAAREQGVALLRTDANQFQTSARIHALLAGGRAA